MTDERLPLEPVLEPAPPLDESDRQERHLRSLQNAAPPLETPAEEMAPMRAEVTRAEVLADDKAPQLFDMAPDPTAIALSLRDRYVIPPFTVLDTRQGYWQERRRLWLTLPIKSELGRHETESDFEGANWRGYTTPAGRMTETVANEKYGKTGMARHTSIFDPVLCEIVYRWFGRPGGLVIDPFAGGSVRGILAAALGQHYLGIDLRPAQVEANRAQAKEMGELAKAADWPTPEWIVGDANDESLETPKGNLLFTCPPYGDLEVYSDDPRDLSTMDAATFNAAYRCSLQLAATRLKQDRFACVVVGNIRDKKGILRSLTGQTIDAFESVGVRYHNDAVLVNSIGTGAIRAQSTFNATRKLVRLHQQLLVFCKGDARKATEGLEDLGGKNKDKDAG